MAPSAVAPVLADGMTHRWSRQEPADLVREKAQYALINFDDGIQKMIIQIRVGKEDFLAGEKMLWMFPVPSPAEDVSLNLINGSEFPYVMGHFTRDLAQYAIYKSFFMTSVTQVYTIPFSAMFVLVDTGRYPRTFFGKGPDTHSFWNVTVSEHIEKFGLVSEVISAENRFAIQEYLMERSVTLPYDAMMAIDGYINEGFSFSVSWISNTTQFASSADPDNNIYDLGISLSFPSDRIFFPLKMTSVYNDDIIPIVLQIIDTASPAPGQKIVEDLDMFVDYAYDDSVSVSSGLFDFFDEQITDSRVSAENGIANLDLEYTLVVLESPSNLFTDDLWFAEGGGIRVTYDGFMKDNWILVSILLIILISMLSSMIAGVMVFKGLKPDKKKFAMLGLANLLTIIGLALIYVKLEASRRYIDCTAIDFNVEKENKPVEAAPLSYYLLTFTLIFLAIEAAIYLPLFLIA